MANFCGQCGAAVAVAGDKFCRNCGVPLDLVDGVAPSQEQPVVFPSPMDGNQMKPEQKSMFYPAQTQIESQMPAPVEAAAFQQQPVQQPPVQQPPVQAMPLQFIPPQSMQLLDRCPDTNGQPAGVYISEEEFQRRSQIPYSAQGE